MERSVTRRRLLTTAAATGLLAAGPAVIVRPGWSQSGAITIIRISSDDITQPSPDTGNKRCA